ncbi:MAG: A24 family peptidase [Bacillota bacterium]
MITSVVLVVVLAISVYTDVKYRKIYNAATFTGIITGLAWHGKDAGFPGAIFSLQGLGLGLAILLLPFLLGGMGAGDVKLLGTIGALQGPGFVVFVALGMALTGGLMALVVLIKRRQLGLAFRRLAVSLHLIRGASMSGFLGNLDRDEYSGSLPYAVAIAAGVMITFIFERFGSLIGG